MCELCEKYGEEGKPWYLNPRNYARPLYKRLEKEERGVLNLLGSIRSIELVFERRL